MYPTVSQAPFTRPIKQAITAQVVALFNDRAGCSVRVPSRGGSMAT
jgi:hypothetical protein